MIHTIQKKVSPVALVIATYQPTKLSADLLRLAIDSIQRFTKSKASIWVVDVDSPEEEWSVRPREYPDVNFIISNEPPLDYRTFPRWRKWIGQKPERHGSFANALTLQLAREVFEKIGYKPEYFMTLQSDIMCTHELWLETLLNMFDDKTFGVGVREQLCFDKSAAILHTLGCVYDYNKMCELGIPIDVDFPRYDVAERMMVAASNRGWKLRGLPNTFIDPDLISLLGDKFANLNVDRTLNAENEVIFMHLGRGIVKTLSNDAIQGKTSPEEWIEFGYNTILGGDDFAPQIVRL